MPNLKGRKIEAMHRLYGVYMGKRCGECPHLIEHNFRGFHGYKCAVYGDTCSEATDWRLKWQACGMIGREAGPNARPILEVIRYERTPCQTEPEPVIPGQITIDELLRGE